MMSRTAYNNGGHPPHESKFIYTYDQMIEVIEKNARVWLDDLTEATIEPTKDGKLAAYVWIPRNSKHIVDNSLKNSNSAINASVQSYSPQMKEFMDKFCEKKMKRLINPNERERSEIVGIEILLENLLCIEFDVTGYEFGKKFGDKYRKKTNIQIIPDFRPVDSSDGKKKYTKISNIAVIKYFGRRQTGSKRPTPCFNAR